MKCSQVENLLPLYVEGDSPSRQRHAVLVHLETCARCAQLRVEFKQSQDLLRACKPPDVDGKFFNDVSAAVRAEFVRRQLELTFYERIMPPWLGRPLFVAPIVLLCVACVLYFYLGKANRSSSQIASIAVDTANVPSGERQRREVIAENSEAVIEVTEQTRKTPQRHRTKSSSRRKAESSTRSERAQREDPPIEFPSLETVADEIQMPEPEPIIAHNAGQMVRTDIQTTDPNIRIVWFTHANKDASSTFPGNSRD